MDEAILEDSADTFNLVDEFWYGYKSEKKKCVKRGLQTEIHEEIGETDKERMGDTVTGHRRDSGFVR